MTDTIDERERRGPRATPRQHRDPEHDVETVADVPEGVPEPRFGLAYVVSAAARFDAPHEALGDFLTGELATLGAVDELVSSVRRVLDRDAADAVVCSGAFRCTIDDRVRLERLVEGTYIPCTDPLSLSAFGTVLSRWARHLEQVPTQLDDVAAEAAAAQRRVAAMSWLESGVAMAAGNGWSHEATQLDQIFHGIADGAREQVGAMSDAGESWSRIRGGLDRRRGTDAQVDAIVSALDHLLGAN